MSEDSKRRQELLRQIASRGQVVNPSYLERALAYLISPKKWEIVDRTTAIQAGEIETHHFRLCFDYLDDNVCHYDQFDSTKAKALIRLLKRMTSCEVNALESSGIVRDRIPNTEPYTNLFLKLTPDVTHLLETELPDGGRVFFFVTGDKINLISIESKHRPLD